MALAFANAGPFYAGLWELFVRYSCRSDVHKPFQMRCAAFLTLLDEAGLVVRARSAKNSAPSIEETAARRIFGAAGRSRVEYIDRRSASTKSGRSASNSGPRSRLDFGQFCQAIQEVAQQLLPRQRGDSTSTTRRPDRHRSRQQQRPPAQADEETFLRDIVQTRILDPLLYPSRRAELLHVLQCAYRSEQVVDIYKQVRQGFEDILNFYVSPGLRQRLSLRLDYAAFGEFCNDFDMQDRGLTRLDLCTVYTTAMRVIGSDAGLDVPALFDALILLAHWVYSARYEGMAISAKVKMMLVVMARVSAERKKQVAVDSSRYRGQGQHLTAVASRFRRQVMTLWKKDGRPNYVQDQVLRPSKSLGQLLQTVVDMPDFEDHASDCNNFDTDKENAEQPPSLSMQARPSEDESERQKRRPSVELREQRQAEEEERQMILSQIAELQRKQRQQRQDEGGRNHDERHFKEADSDGSSDKGFFRNAEPLRVRRSSAQQRAWNDAAAAAAAPAAGSHLIYGEEGDPSGKTSTLHQRLDLRRLSSLPHPHEEYLRNDDAPLRLATRHTSRQPALTHFELDEAAAAAAAAALDDLGSVAGSSVASERSPNSPNNGERSWTRMALDEQTSHHATSTAAKEGAVESLDTADARLGLESSQWDWEADKPNDENIRPHQDIEAGDSGTRVPASVAAGLRLADMTFDQAMAQMRAASQY